LVNISFFKKPYIVGFIYRGETEESQMTVSAFLKNGALNKLINEYMCKIFCSSKELYL